MGVSNYIWGFAHRFMTLTFTFVTTIILANFISPEDFGKVGILAIFIGVGTTLADSGMGGSIIKEKNLTNTDCSTVFVFNFFFSLIIYFILFIFAPAIESYFNVDDLTTILRLISLPIIVNAITIVPRSLCYKTLKFKTIFYVSLTSNALSTIIVVVMAIIGVGIWALVSYYIILAILESTLYYYVCKYIPTFKFDTASFKKLFSFGFFTTISSLIDTAYENILSIIFGRHLGATEVGFYTQAKRIEEVPSKSIATSISNIAFPVLCKISDNEELYKDKIKHIQISIVSIVTPIMVIIALYSKEIITLLFGIEWINSSYYLTILCIAGIFNVVESTNRTFIKSLGRSDIIFKLSLIKRGVGFILIFFSVFCGIKYTLTAYIIASAIGAVINTYSIYRLMNYSFFQQLYDWNKPLIMGFIVYYINYVFMNYFSSLIFQISFTIFTLAIYLLLQPTLREHIVMYTKHKQNI